MGRYDFTLFDQPIPAWIVFSENA